ncbi:hypothetical protein B0H13DRAFT_1899170 [Mycena leptocephala]|nr:hypothetical protein B0H13DRAFT_1899170 [Mycena leptocephala]
MTRASCTWMSAFGTVVRVPSTKIGDLAKFEPVGGVGVHVIVVGDIRGTARRHANLVLLFLGSFADHLLSEHTPFTVTVLHPLELDHSRFFHSLRSLQLPFASTPSRHDVMFSTSALAFPHQRGRHELYVRTTGEKDCAEYPQHTSRTDAESACWGRSRSLEWAYADADSEMTAVWAWSDAAGGGADTCKLETRICVSGAGAEELREPASYFFAVGWESVVCRPSIEGRLGTTPYSYSLCGTYLGAMFKA